MSKTAKVRILIVDDHHLVRMGLAGLINTQFDLKVIGEASDGEQAVKLYEKLQPDLVLMDTRMPVKNGIEAILEIRRKNPEARILMLTAFDGDADIRRALDAGAKGYVLKSSTGEALIPAVRAVAQGQMWMPQDITARLDAKKTFEHLTQRELEILNQMAKGLANKNIADVFNISENTVKGFVKNILAKLRVADRTEAVTVALQRGIIHL